ncbi:hypothetical protein [uncultured Sulfitobacter sp.]|nr:hypothetical protein [uncultured Sulfitobacter sp.]
MSRALTDIDTANQIGVSYIYSGIFVLNKAFPCRMSQKTDLGL